MGGEKWKGGQWEGKEESEGWRPHLRRADVGRRPVSPPIITPLTCAEQMRDAALSPPPILPRLTCAVQMGRRLVTADELLARLSGHAEEGTAALRVH